MASDRTVLFTDLHGSTGVFEALGNTEGAEIVTQFNEHIAGLVRDFQGQVIKTLGDGVMAIFENAHDAIDAAIAIQREHSQRLLSFPVSRQLPVRIGMSTGDVEWVNGDCYGDAVNVASRLCDLCGPKQIMVNESSVNSSPAPVGSLFRSLGPIALRGRNEPCNVFQVEWLPDTVTEQMTVLGNIDVEHWMGAADSLGREVELVWGDEKGLYRAFELPVTIGRVSSNKFVVSDPRVSRIHAQLSWKNGSVVLDDMSSYGTCVRFDGSLGGDAVLRRSSCVLHGSGDLALGAGFNDKTVPIVRFHVR
jgi:class 3 adenylate cyclase